MNANALELHRPEIDTPSPLTPMTMIDRALATNASAETLGKLFDLQERYEASQARKAFDAAMADAKAEFEPIVKNRRVYFESQKSGSAATDYRHEDLAQIERQISPILTAHGLSYRFRATSEPEQPVRVTCIVAHRGGHSEETTLSAGRDKSGAKNDIQAIGSAITYLQRYTLKAALGLAVSHDDDGRAADPRDEAPISPEQVEKVLRLAEETKTDIPKFCQYLKIDSIPAMTVVQYNRALDALEAKRNKQGASDGPALPEWFAARLGKVTASRIADVTAKTKTGWGASRKNYMAELVAERLTGQRQEAYSSAAMQWGTEKEPDARAAYEFYRDVTVTDAFFVPHPTIADTGASPDGYVGEDGLVEIKCPNTATHIDTLLGLDMPNKYFLQIQWQLACTGRQWCDFASYDPRLPESMSLYVERVKRDDIVISAVQQDVADFLHEVRATVERLRAKFERPAAFDKATAQHPIMAG